MNRGQYEGAIMPIEMMPCPKCGEQNSVKKTICFNCGQALHEQPVKQETPGTTQAMQGESQEGTQTETQQDATTSTSTTAALPGVRPLKKKNTSGKGRNAEIPNEIKGWNWGAFFLHFIWGFAHKTYATIIVLAIIMLNFSAKHSLGSISPSLKRSMVPSIISLVAFLLMLGFMIFFGLKGSEMAWQNRYFPDGVEQFKKVQKSWAIAALVIFIILAVMGILFMVLGALALNAVRSSVPPMQ